MRPSPAARADSHTARSAAQFVSSNLTMCAADEADALGDAVRRPKPDDPRRGRGRGYARSANPRSGVERQLVDLRFWIFPEKSM